MVTPKTIEGRARVGGCLCFPLEAATVKNNRQVRTLCGRYVNTRIYKAQVMQEKVTSWNTKRIASHIVSDITERHCSGQES